MSFLAGQLKVLKGHALMIWVVGTLMVPAFVSGATAQTPVPPDGVIDAPGSYILTGNRSNNGGEHAILIAADNVDLDLNGKIVQCTPQEKPISHGVRADFRSDVTVRNGRMLGCVVGVSVAGTDNARIEGIDFTGTRFVGIVGSEEITGLQAMNNTFADIAGWSGDAYAVGINQPGSDCVIENNIFRNLYRQSEVLPDVPGEGTGIIQSPGSTGCTIRGNWFKNEEVGTHLEIGIWVGNSSVSVQDNSFTNIGRAIASSPGYDLLALGNHFWMRQAQTGSYAIGAQNGLAKDNLIVGYDTPIQGNIPVGTGNVSYP